MPFGGFAFLLNVVGLRVHRIIGAGLARAGGTTLRTQLLAGSLGADDVRIGCAAALVRAERRRLGGSGLRSRERGRRGQRLVARRDGARRRLGHIGRRRREVLLGGVALVLWNRGLGRLSGDPGFALGGLTRSGVAGLGLLARPFRL